MLAFLVKLNRGADYHSLQVAYRGYWQRALLSLIHKNSALSMKDLTDMTAIKQSDVHETLDSLDLLKYWRGEHVIAPHGR